MSRSLKRLVALLLLAAAAFAQASTSVLACHMDRGGLAQAMQAGEPCPCEDGGCADMPELTNACLAHCTSDLQLRIPASQLVRSPADSPVLVAPADSAVVLRPDLARPVSTVPVRILLQSFQI